MCFLSMFMMHEGVMIRSMSPGLVFKFTGLIASAVVLLGPLLPRLLFINAHLHKGWTDDRR